MKKFFIGLIFVSALFAAEKTVIIEVEGMTCPLCTSAIKRSLKTTPGVVKAKVLLSTKKATVVYDDAKTDTSKLLHAIEVVGYKGKVLEVKNEK
ncbi:periplasmic mercuric ion binding protein [Nautilia profundicola AmH]|uniref:Periplasmic mercuric ion binding protein n=1 Tax=Nautilia profundicola (strain ATCC BAA-1463 / DSM 18972 / AmH) TaxID=598659 RepID=B9L5P4_NAUPA|nr:heavy metal-associated domain-containing protein [Nautilia profundicola]ACM93111.1 periplasmic mercuric ion binding protein [Nautilia profundicola AmH]